ALTRPAAAGNIRGRRRRRRRSEGGANMQRALLSAGILAGALVAQPVLAQAPEMSLARLDCGTPTAPTAVNQRFSDTYAYGDLKIQLVYSCYLVKHGSDYLLWD